MIKFKKMSTTAKVVSGVGVAAVAGVAIIPVINTFIPNEKSKVQTYEYQGMFYKNKEDAEAARNKFNAMSGLVKLMQGKADNPQHIDYKPLMAEFVSFVSKLFVIKVFQMDAETSTINHFQYDGMSTVQKQELMQKQIAGEIKYGDLQDMTSLVKYATAQKAGNTWMFTPVDQMMLSILGDGSGQGYSQGELKYAEISQTITKLKDNYNNYYKKLITDKFNGVSYSLVHGLTHHDDDELAEADHEKDATVNEGDGSGDEYTADLIRQFKQWGTLKTAFESSKKKLDDYVSANTLTSDAMKAAFVQMVADNAVVGWNNVERYSSEEIELRDLLIKAAAEQNSLDMASVPGGSTDANVIQGWNWAPSGDQTDNVYKDWQLELARDMQDRAKLLALHWTAAPAGAVKGFNAKPTGDGTGNEYLQQAFDLKQDFSDTDKAIGDLSAAIDAAVTAGTKAAPKDGVALTAKEAVDRKMPLALVGKHIDPVGLHDDIDYTQSFQTHEIFEQLQQDIKDAQKTQADFQDQISKTLLDITPGRNGKDGKPDMSGFTLESEIISNILKASSIAGPNYAQNYNKDQVALTKAKAKAADLQQQIDDLNADGIKPALDGALADNTLGRGDQSNKLYDQKQIDLRELISQLAAVNNQIGSMKGYITQAPDNAKESPTGLHQAIVGLGDGKVYGAHFADAVANYNKYQDAIDKLQVKIDAIEKDFPGFKATGGTMGTKTFQQLKDDGAVAGTNTGEQYTATEIQYTKDEASLASLQSALSTVNDQIAKLKVNVDPSKWLQLAADVEHNVVPDLGPNHMETGDKTGADYTDEDVAYHDNLEALKGKDGFPDGNPWWSDPLTAKSDEAYAALYQDWVNAIGKGTLSSNHPAIGDGSTNKFENDKWKVYESFFKATLDEWHHESSPSTIGAYLKIIEDYIVKHQTLKTAGGYPTNAESASSAATQDGDGDKSGNVYFDLTEGYALFKAAYVTTHKNPLGGPDVTLKGAADGAKAAYQNLLTGHSFSRAQYQINLDAANKIIRDYVAGRDPLATAAQKAKDDFDGTQQNGQKGADYKNEAEKLKLKALRDGFFDSKVTDDEIVALSKMSLQGNTAGTFTPDQQKLYQELQGIDQKIKDDETAYGDALQAKGDVINEQQNRGNTVDTNYYLRYTKSTAPTEMLADQKNTVPIGVGDNHWYSAAMVAVMNDKEKIKAEIATHISDPKAQADEYTRIMAMQNNSEPGLNSATPPVGDKSGNNYEHWEVDLWTHMVDVVLKKDIAKGNIGDKLAPVGAVEGWNGPGIGDGSGNSYRGADWRTFINVFVPKFKGILDTIDKTKKSLEDDKARKVYLEGLHLDPSLAKDPTKVYRTQLGKEWSITQFNQAKIFAAEKVIADKMQQETDDAEKLKDSTAKALKDYEDLHKTEYNDALSKAQMAQSWVDSLDPANIGGLLNYQTTAGNAFSAANAKLWTWWNNNKGKAIGPAGSQFENIKISMDFNEFVGDSMDSKSGSMKSIQAKLNDVNAHADGKPNLAPVKAHPQEDLTLRDALEHVVKFPAGSDLIPDTSEYASNAFNTLFMMYKNAIGEKKWAKPVGYVSPSIQVGETEVLIKTSTTKHQISANTFKLYKEIMFTGDEASRQKTMDNFNLWLFNFFQPTTAIRNAPARGYIEPGQTGITKYNNKFFGSKGHPIKDQAGVDANALGKAAKIVADLYGKVQIMGPTSVKGVNWDTSGDNSPLSYTQNDINYYKALKEQAEKSKAIKDLQAKIKSYQPPLGEVLIQTPKGWTGSASAVHADPVGDGTGNVYTDALIDAMHNYLSYEQQIQDLQAQIENLRLDYVNGPQDANPIDWDEVKKPKYIGVTHGLNHPELWSKEEIAYRGADASQSDIQTKIDDIKKTKIPDPTKAGAHGEASTDMVPVTPAPAGVKAGWNSAPTGIHNGHSYSQAQIDERDELKKLNDELAKTKTLIGTLSATLKAEGVSEAPSVDTPPVPDLIWHKVAVGDGSGNTYDQKIFDDMAALQKLKDTTAATVQLKNDFIASTGQTAINTIDDELSKGMIPGMNFAARYSDAEIALRDNKVKLGTALDHLHLVGSGDQFKPSQALTGDSIVGKNIKQVGIGDDNTYDQKELDLRTLNTKIAEIEQQHGLVETDIAHVDKIVYDSSDSKEDAAKGKDTATTQTVEEFYGNIDLDSAIVGSNHAPRGDQTGSYYDTASAQAFKDVVALQAQLKADNARIAVLKANWKAAPLGAVAITTAEATLKANDPTLAGKHKAATGDATGNVYKPKDKVNVVTAAEYVKNLEAYNKAKADLETFTKLHPNEVKFFEYKTLGGQTWNPVVGRNWTDASFDYKSQDDARERLKIGKTMVNLDEDGIASEFGINRGQLQSMANKDTTLVMYQGSDSHIADEVLGSDRVRIGYVLNPQGTSHISDDAPVLSSLEAVAEYLQQHPSLAPDSLIKKFALLQGIKSSSIDEDIEEVTMSRDRFKTIEENYGIEGDK